MPLVVQLSLRTSQAARAVSDTKHAVSDPKLAFELQGTA